MARVVRPGGTVAAYAWDMLGGGFPMEPLRAVMEAMGMAHSMRPPSIEASRLDAMNTLWRDAGFDAVETRAITVQRSFADFDDLWATYLLSPSTGGMLDALPTTQSEQLKARLRTSLPADVAGRITYSARANAVKGRVPE
ncbi:MAG TPA: hypothetical protein VFX37_11745 [Pseudolabrys sp.]|nr:hypothetical protein [Pseudolabrys sp.]